MTHDIIRKRLLERAGIVDAQVVSPVGKSVGKLRETQWSSEFERLMRNRMVAGAFRYGLITDPATGSYDMVGSIMSRMMAYKRTGNLEYLVDVANLCLVEFEAGQHPNRHFESIDDGIHTQC